MLWDRLLGPFSGVPDVRPDEIEGAEPIIVPCFFRRRNRVPRNSVGVDGQDGPFLGRCRLRRRVIGHSVRLARLRSAAGDRREIGVRHRSKSTPTICRSLLPFPLNFLLSKKVPALPKSSSTSVPLVAFCKSTTAACIIFACVLRSSLTATLAFFNAASRCAVISVSCSAMSEMRLRLAR